MLKPIRQLSPELIIEEWENIQRIMVSLALKTTAQSTIVRKLSAFARKNKTRRALWAYDHIFRSLYLLDDIDSPPLRRNVQQALNRGESYHQLRRAVSHANVGKLRFKTEHEQQIWGECAHMARTSFTSVGSSADSPEPRFVVEVNFLLTRLSVLPTLAPACSFSVCR